MEIRGRKGGVGVCGTWSWLGLVDFAGGLRLVVCGLWLVACGLWLVACGLWLVACGLRLVAGELLIVGCGL